MRIIAGKHRGRVLAEFQGNAVRPTADRVKESLFNILAPRMAGARVLDLFCGSGALGLESLSRGASEVLFNDSSRESLAILKKNLNLLKESATATNADFRTCLARASGKFDLIFADPPYFADYRGEILSIVRERELLKETGLVLYESEQPASGEVIEGFALVDERCYGRTYVAFYGRKL